MAATTFPATAPAAPALRTPSPLRVLRTGAWALGVLAVAAIAISMLAPPLLGLQRYVIVGKSMTGSIAKGSVVFDEPTAAGDLKLGDVITYQPPLGSGPVGMVTHRIVWIGKDKNGNRAFQTKGDFNAVADPWKFTVGPEGAGRVVAHVPYLGWAIAALGVREVRMAVIGIPALIIALLSGGDVLRELRPRRRG